MEGVEGLERARADLDRGDARKARDRLKGLIVADPENREVRGLLAEAYRQDRQWPEAGRWGYLVGPAASGREREAFERHNAFGWKSRITEARLRRLLRSDDLAAIADETGRELLRQLPRKRRPGRSDGPFAAVSRRVAALRSRVSWALMSDGLRALMVIDSSEAESSRSNRDEVDAIREGVPTVTRAGQRTAGPTGPRARSVGAGPYRHEDGTAARERLD